MWCRSEGGSSKLHKRRSDCVILINMELHKKKTALTFGAFIGGWHVVWSVFVALGWAQGWLNFVASLHFLNHSITIQPFALGKAAVLVTSAFLGGCIGGWVFAALWNALHRQR